MANRVIPVNKINKYIPTIDEGIITYLRGWDYYRTKLIQGVKYCEGIREIKRIFKEEKKLRKEIIIGEEEKKVENLFENNIDLRFLKENIESVSIPVRRCRFTITEYFLSQLENLFNAVIILEKPLAMKRIVEVGKFRKEFTLNKFNDFVEKVLGNKAIGVRLAYKEKENTVLIRPLALFYPTRGFENLIRLLKEEKISNLTIFSIYDF